VTKKGGYHEHDTAISQGRHRRHTTTQLPDSNFVMVDIGNCGGTKKELTDPIRHLASKRLVSSGPRAIPIQVTWNNWRITPANPRPISCGTRRALPLNVPQQFGKALPASAIAKGTQEYRSRPCAPGWQGNLCEEIIRKIGGLDGIHR
jgi:hypothetical protein